ncbi:dUTP diphosphatase [Candidatus Woesearchaeota archaeon]|nr:MAG: dUTP diphosphatase [Candidatus Woesearchaeota archaeon]
MNNEERRQKLVIPVKKLTDSATLPTYAKEDDAGLDLYSTHEATILPGERALIKTGIALAIPQGHAGLIWPRSGLSAKHGIDVLAGVVDAGYRGEVGVVLLNTGKNAVTLRKGERVAQLLIQPVNHAELKEVDTLPESQRAQGGFGSTGK